MAYSKSRTSLLIAFLIASGATFAQHEVNFHDPINIEGHVPEKNGPQHAGGAEKGGPEGPRDKPTNGPTTTIQAQPIDVVAEMSRGRISGKDAVPVTVGGVTYMVSPQANADLKEFIKTYNATGHVGQLVAAAATLFAMFGLITEPDLSKIDFNIDETVMVLSAPSIFAAAWRAQALDYVRSYINPSRAHTQEGRMWQRMEDLIREPGRYRDGGIKREPNGQIQMRALPAQRFRDVPGDYPLTQADEVELGRLIDSLRRNPIAMDYLAKSDAVLGIYTQDPQGRPRLSARDQYLMNMALLRLAPQEKTQLAQAFWRNTQFPAALTPAFWSSMSVYLQREEWARNSHIAILRHMAGFSDDLGFPDELPRYDDGFWTNIAPAALAATGPIFVFPQHGPQVWTFHYPGPGGQ